MLYALYEDGEKVFEGTSHQIAEKLFVDYKMVCVYARRQGKLLNKYRVMVVGRPPSKRIPVEKPPKKTKDEIRLDYLSTHLQTYGNTVSKTDPEKYLPALSEMGIDVKVRKVYDNNSTNPCARGRKSCFYVLERI